jgi:hypothetical protein
MQIMSGQFCFAVTILVVPMKCVKAPWCSRHPNLERGLGAMQESKEIYRTLLVEW